MCRLSRSAMHWQMPISAWTGTVNGAAAAGAGIGDSGAAWADDTGDSACASAVWLAKVASNPTSRRTGTVGILRHVVFRFGIRGLAEGSKAPSRCSRPKAHVHSQMSERFPCNASARPNTCRAFLVPRGRSFRVYFPQTRRGAAYPKRRVHLHVMRGVVPDGRRGPCWVRCRVQPVRRSVPGAAVVRVRPERINISALRPTIGGARQAAEVAHVVVRDALAEPRLTGFREPPGGLVRDLPHHPGAAGRRSPGQRETRRCNQSRCRPALEKSTQGPDCRPGDNRHGNLQHAWSILGSSNGAGWQLPALPQSRRHVMADIRSCAA